MFKNFYKKTTKFFVLIPIIIGGVVFGFFDSHFIKVSANPDYLIVSLNHIDFGTVFPQEEFIRDFTVKLTDAISESGSPGEVKYKITENPKPGYPQNLSAFVESQKDPSEFDTDTIDNADLKITGNPFDDDISDKWFLYFDVPPIFGNLPQDYTPGDPAASERGNHGVDIKIELTEEPIFHPYTWIVDDDGVECPDRNFDSIAEATSDDRIWDGDTISVCPGSYQGNILVKKSLAIKSTDGKNHTFVNGAGSLANGFIVQNTSRVTISGFTIQNFSGSSASGIKFANVQRSKIFHNTIQGNYLGISLASSSDNHLSFNKILNNGNGIVCFPGISGETSNDNNVSHNTILGQNETGILIAANHNFSNTGWRIIFNKIKNSLSNGLEIQNGSDFRIAHNKIYDNSGYGIIISSSNLGTDSDYNISFNRITGSGETAFHLSSLNNNKIRFNRIYNNSGKGIVLENIRNSELRNDRITDNGSTGIHLIGGENNLIKSARVYDNNGDGILLENSDSNEIIRVRTNDNNLSGILLDNSNINIIEKNKAYNNGEYGIGLKSGSSDNQIIRNRTKKNGNYDLYWDGFGNGNEPKKNKFKTSWPNGWWN
jgi:parallel beta-helix repeat protein